MKHRDKIFQFVKNKYDNREEIWYTSGLFLLINGKEIGQTWDGCYFDNEKIACFADVKYQNPKYGIYHDYESGLTYFEYEEVECSNGALFFEVLPRCCKKNDGPEDCPFPKCFYKKRHD